jgi:hypothetical protein
MLKLLLYWVIETRKQHWISLGQLKREINWMSRMPVFQVMLSDSEWKSNPLDRRYELTEDIRELRRLERALKKLILCVVINCRARLTCFEPNCSKTFAHSSSNR